MAPKLSTIVTARVQIQLINKAMRLTGIYTDQYNVPKLKRDCQLTEEQEQLITQSGLIDVKDTLFRLGEDRALFAQVLRWFAADLPTAFQNIENCLASNDGKTTREAVHKLKGSAANAGAHRLYKMAATAELHCKSNELAEVQKLLQEMHKEVCAIVELVGKMG